MPPCSTFSSFFLVRLNTCRRTENSMSRTKFTWVHFTCWFTHFSVQVVSFHAIQFSPIWSFPHDSFIFRWFFFFFLHTSFIYVQIIFPPCIIHLFPCDLFSTKDSLILKWSPPHRMIHYISILFFFYMIHLFFQWFFFLTWFFLTWFISFSSNFSAYQYLCYFFCSSCFVPGLVEGKYETFMPHNQQAQK